MNPYRSAGRAAAAASLCLFLALPAATQQPTAIAFLGRLEAGQWELKGPSNARIATLCLGNPLLLTQPQHGAAPCTRSVIAADAREATVHYTCPGVGNGRTTLRFETPRLVQIESQGLDQGVPFALRAEARRIGAC